MFPNPHPFAVAPGATLTPWHAQGDGPLPAPWVLWQPWP